jgi:hypothetical protein
MAFEERRGLIELTVRAGLCNRMREIDSALALARAANKGLRVYWLKNKNLDCPYGQLFAPIPGVRIIDIETSRKKAFLSPASLWYRVRKRAHLWPVDLFLGNEEIRRYRDAGIDLASVVSKAKRCGIETFMRFYRSAGYVDLKPRAEIMREVEKTIGRLDPGGLIGVHIRRGDNAAAIQVSPVEAFRERMQREVDEDPQATFFLATDDPATERQMKERFPGKVVTRPKVFARDRPEGVRDALVDVLVLSRCRLILGSYWSSFSDTASELAGAKRETVRVPAAT